MWPIPLKSEWAKKVLADIYTEKGFLPIISFTFVDSTSQKGKQHFPP